MEGTMRGCPRCGLRYPATATTCFVDGLPLEDIHDPRVGTVLAGRYELEEVLGEGGMATVYRAHHRLVNRPCAVKVMKPRYATQEVVRERFRREAKAAQKLAHPNIIEIFEQGETEDGCLYLVMELLSGHTLADELERSKISLERALPILIQIARALARAHDLEVIHRDLKPENIFLAQPPDAPERVVLLDFGIARSTEDVRLTESGEVFGTPQYMAPERITSIDAGPSADLYAVGVIMFEMLTGGLPFEATHAAGFFVKHLQERAAAPPQSRCVVARRRRAPGERSSGQGPRGSAGGCSPPARRPGGDRPGRRGADSVRAGHGRGELGAGRRSAAGRHRPLAPAGDGLRTDARRAARRRTDSRRSPPCWTRSRVESATSQSSAAPASSISSSSRRWKCAAGKGACGSGTPSTPSVSTRVGLATKPSRPLA